MVGQLARLPWGERDRRHTRAGARRGGQGRGGGQAEDFAVRGSVVAVRGRGEPGSGDGGAEQQGDNHAGEDGQDKAASAGRPLIKGSHDGGLLLLVFGGDTMRRSRRWWS
jgi:hypothetical protein